MKKTVAFFSDSAREFKNVRTVTACGLFAALAFILESFSIQLGNPSKSDFPVCPTKWWISCSDLQWDASFRA